jgi:ABC-type polysaccharide transport system, permease component
MLGKRKKKDTWEQVKKQKELVLLSLPFVIFAIVFYYLPLTGWTMAFQNFKPGKEFFEQTWVGFEQFKFLFSDKTFLQVLRNTLGMSLINLVLGFVFSIGFALLLNEVRFLKAKKFIQTISYLPHFLSWIVVTGLVRDVLSTETGIINQIMVGLGIFDSPVNFFAHTKYFWWIVGFSNVWKSTGWGSIIYLSAMTAISPELYEAAQVDGANRFQRMMKITLPSIKPTIFILLIINIGNVLNAGFEVQYLLGNGLVQSVSQTIDIFVLKYGISLNNYSLATAAGIFKSAISIILIVMANRIAKAAGEERLF